MIYVVSAPLSPPAHQSISDREALDALHSSISESLQETYDIGEVTLTAPSTLADRVRIVSEDSGESTSQHYMDNITDPHSEAEIVVEVDGEEYLYELITVDDELRLAPYEESSPDPETLER